MTRKRTPERRSEDRQELTAVPTSYLTMLRVTLTAMIVGLVLLMAFAYYAVNKAQTARQEELDKQTDILNAVRSLTDEVAGGVEQHRESALKQHCAQALLETPGPPSQVERKLIEKVCTH